MRPALAAAAALVAVAAASPAFAERVAVLDVGGKAQSPKLRRYLAKQVRARAEEVLGPRRWTLQGRDDMLSALGPSRRECVTSGRCSDEATAALGVDLVVRSQLTQGDGLRLTLVLADLRTRATVRTTEIKAPGVDGLLGGIPKACEALFPEPPKARALTPEDALAAISDETATPSPPEEELDIFADEAPDVDAGDPALGGAAGGRVVRPGPSEVRGKGRIDEGQLRAALDEHLPQIERCYLELLEQDPSLAGTVDLRLEVDPQGRITGARVVGNSTGNTTLAACIQDRAQQWRVPKPWGGGVEVALPLALEQPAGGSAGDGGAAETPWFATGDALEGTLAPEKVNATISGRMSEVSKCYRKALKQDPRLAGGLTVQFRIVSSGRVERPAIVQDDLQSERVSRCILARLVHWSFPTPQGGSVLVRYPFSFSFGGQR